MDGEPLRTPKRLPGVITDAETAEVLLRATWSLDPLRRKLRGRPECRVIQEAIDKIEAERMRLFKGNG